MAVEAPRMAEYTTVFPSGKMIAESARPLEVNLVNFKSENGAGPRSAVHQTPTQSSARSAATAAHPK